MTSIKGQQKSEENLETFLHKLLHDSLGGYIFLIQSSQAFSVRHGAASPTTNVATYRRANLRTPAENAVRDWQAGPLWLDHIVRLVLEQETCAQKKLVWLQTLPGLSASTRRRNENIHWINLATDPFGWNVARDENICSNGNQDDLQDVLKKMKEFADERDASVNGGQECNVPVILESLVPLCNRHGFAKAVKFIKAMKRKSSLSPLILPVSVESFSSEEQLVLQGLSSASLILQDGEATLIRQGVRERSNVVRQSFQYRIDSSTVNSNNNRRVDVPRLVVETETQVANENRRISVPETDRADGVDTPAGLSLNSSPQVDSSRIFPSMTSTSSKKRAPVQLQIEEERQEKSETPEKTPVPHLYLQDDDPEFEDFDEEDPDDDLDIF